MRRLLGLAIVGLTCASFAPPSASAHPLGNFTTNQLVQVRVDSDETRIAYVLDQAEIPTFQQTQRFDGDGDGEIGDGESGALADALLGEIESGLGLAIDGRAVRLTEARKPELSFPPGQGGLPLTRLEVGFSAPLPSNAERVEVTNDAFAGRVGWRAIQALPGEGTDVVSSVPATDPTNRLTAYPQDLLSSPPSDTRAGFEVEAGSGSVSAPDGETAEASAEARGPDGFADALAGGDTRGLLILVLLASAFGWGALHALSPGHGKAMVAGYLAGSRGTPRHAALLGLTVTATHTVSVFALGLVTLLASEYVVPERLYPWLGVASGALVVVIGLTVMRQRLRRWRAARAGGDAHLHGHLHHHGHSHAHADPAGGERAPIRTRELLGLGVSGGLVPCPSALVVLIAAISQHRVGLGLGLILAFSLGLAATVTGVGLVTIWGGRLVQRLRPDQRLFGGRLVGAMPALSASLIVAVGVLITYRAIPELG